MPNWGAHIDVVDNVEKVAIASDLARLLADTDVSPTTVTVSTPTAAPTVDWAAGTATATTDDDSVSVLRAEVNLDEVARSEGALQLGDIRYHILASSLSSVPGVGSTVVDGSDRLQVIATSVDPLGLLYTLTARRTP